MGKPTPEQLARINQLAREPLSEDQVYVFPGKLVGDKVVPNRYERLTPNALSKFADQAKQGISLLLDHSWANYGVMTIPLGRTFDSSLQQEQDGELALYADHYMLRGQTINGIATDELAAGIDAGTIFDTSVGFISSDHTCSICGQRYYNSDCSHIRGRSYDGKLCIVEINDGDLMENSLVFDGAYPGAGIVGMSGVGKDAGEKVMQMTVLSEDTKSLPSDGRVFYSLSNKSGLVGYVSKSETERDDHVNELEQVKQQLSAATGLLATVREALKAKSDGEISGAIAVLQAKATIGEQYSARVVEEALGAGVRAMGDAFNMDSMKLALSALPVGEVEKIRDTYNAQAKTALGGGGQHVVTQNHDLPANPAENPHAQKQNVDREQLAKEATEALKRHGHADAVKEAK